jgi:hypothetical protein
MTVLIVCAGEGKGTWGPIGKLAEDPLWEKVVVITSDYFKDRFTLRREGVERIVIDENKAVEDLTEDLRTAFDGKFFGDVAVNVLSGSGKWHMALLAALLKSGAGIRLVGVDKNGNIGEV